MNHYSTILLLPRSTHFPYTTLFQSHRDGDDRRGEAHRLEDHRAVLRAERVARRRVLEAHDGNDLTGTDTLAFLAMVRVHLVDLADPLLLALRGVEHLRAHRKVAGVDADVGELAEVLVAHDLERESGERLVLARGALDGNVLLVHRVALDGADVERARQELDDRVEHGLDALVLERAAAQDRRQLAGDGGAANAGG